LDSFDELFKEVLNESSIDDMINDVINEPPEVLVPPLVPDVSPAEKYLPQRETVEPDVTRVVPYERERRVSNKMPDVPVVDTNKPIMEQYKEAAPWPETIKPKPLYTAAPARSIGVTKSVGLPEEELEIGDRIPSRPERVAMAGLSGATNVVKELGNALSAVGLEAVGEPLSDAIGKFNDRYAKIYEPGLPEKIAAGLGSTATFFLAGMGAVGASRIAALAPKIAAALGTGLASVLESATEAGGVYEESLSKGNTEDQARLSAAATFFANLPLNFVLDKWMFNSMPGNERLKNMVEGGKKEFAQEAIQSLISGISQGELPGGEEVLEEGLIGGLVGGGLASAKTTIDPTLDKYDANLSQIQQAAQERKEQKEQEEKERKEQQERERQYAEEARAKAEEGGKGAGQEGREQADLRGDAKNGMEAQKGRKYTPEEIAAMTPEQRAEILAQYEKTYGATGLPGFDEIFNKAVENSKDLDVTIDAVIADENGEPLIQVTPNEFKSTFYVKNVEDIKTKLDQKEKEYSRPPTGQPANFDSLKKRYADQINKNNNLPREITSQLDHVMSKLEKGIIDDEVKDAVKHGLVHRKLGKHGIGSSDSTEKLRTYCDKNGIPYCAVFVDMFNRGGANAEITHKGTDDATEEIWGKIYAKRLSEFGAIVEVAGEHSDELIEIWPNYNFDQVADIRRSIELEMRAKVEELGLSQTPHPKHGGLPTGALYSSYGIAQGIPGKPGETMRKADQRQELMKKQEIENIKAKQEEKGYINKEEGDTKNESGKLQKKMGDTGRPSARRRARAHSKSSAKPGAETGLQGTGRQGESAEGEADSDISQAGFTIPPHDLAKNLLRNIAGFSKKWFTSTRGKPKSVMLAEESAKQNISAAGQKFAEINNDFFDAVKKVYGEDYLALKKSNPEAYSLINKAIKSKKGYTSLPEGLANIVKKQRDIIDELSKEMVRLGIPDKHTEKIISKNIGEYAHRFYRANQLGLKWSKTVEKRRPDLITKAAKKIISDMIGRANRVTANIQKKMEESDPDPEILVKNMGRLKKVLEIKKTYSKSEVGVQIAKELLHKFDNNLQNVQSKITRAGKKYLDILKKRKRVPPEIRALWGEYEELPVVFQRSAMEMTQVIENHVLLTNIKNIGFNKWLFEKEDIEGRAKYSEKNPDSELIQYASETNKAYEPLNGMWMPKEIADAMSDYHPVSSGVIKWYMKLLGVGKYTKTVLNNITHTRNFLSNPAFLFCNGHNPFSSKTLKAIKKTYNMLSKTGTEEERSYINKLIKAGIIGNDTRTSELQELMGEFNQDDLDILLGKGLMNNIKKAKSVVDKAYIGEDAVWKIVFFESELNRYKKAAPEMSEDELWNLAADRTKDLMPTTSRAVKALELARRSPLIGTFPTFIGETARNTFNTINIAAEEIKNKNSKIRTIGYTRLFSTLAVTSSPFIINWLSKTVFDIDDEEEEGARRYSAPWNKNAAWLFLPKGEDGNLNFVNIGYNIPQSYFANAIISVMNSEDLKDAAISSLWSMAEPFLSPEMTTERIMELWANKTPTGKQIYNPQDKLGNIAQDALYYLWKAIEPGTVSNVVRLSKSIEGKADWEYGTKYDLSVEALNNILGLRIVNVDMRTGLYWKAKHFTQKLPDARLAGRKRQQYDVTKKALLDLYDTLREDIRVAMAYGVNVGDIYKVFDDAGISKTQTAKIIHNQYRDEIDFYVMKKEVMDILRKRGLPFKHIERITSKIHNKAEAKSVLDKIKNQKEKP
jgi:hypothetical protein